LNNSKKRSTPVGRTWVEYFIINQVEILNKVIIYIFASFKNCLLIDEIVGVLIGCESISTKIITSTFKHEDNLIAELIFSFIYDDYFRLLLEKFANLILLPNKIKILCHLFAIITQRTCTGLGFKNA
jgi:hypothetical protein